MFKKTVKLRLFDNHCDFRNHKHGNMWDLASLKEINILNIELNKGILIDFGISMTLPKWYGAKIYPRSSTYKKYGLMLTNSVGIIEYDYSLNWLGSFHRINFGTKPYINIGDRIAQFEIYLLPNAPWYMKILHLFINGFIFKEVDVITTNRGGFGSTD